MSRLCTLLARVLCLASPLVVAVAFWDLHFSPLAIKELLAETLGLLTFLLWWIGKDPAHVRGRGLFNPILPPLLLMVVWSFVSLLWTGPKALAVHHWATFAGVVLLFPPLFDFGRSAVFRRAYRNMLLLIGLLFLVLAAFQINGISLEGLLRTGGGNSRTRVSLTIGHNNGVAPLVLLFSFLAFAAISEIRDRWLRAAFGLYAVACWLVILFALLTRSTILGLLAGFLLLVVLNLLPYWFRRTPRESERSGKVKWVLAGAFLFVVGLSTVGGYFAVRGGEIEGQFNPNLARNLTDRLRTLNPSFLMVDSRARLWAITLQMMRQEPLLGVGFSGAKYEYPLYQAMFFEYHPDFPSGPTTNHTERMHNDYLQWFAETGMIGAVLLLWALFAFLKSVTLSLRGSGSREKHSWFAQVATLIGCVVVAMDAIFSFPGHIAPIAIVFPGLLMLWSGYLPRVQERDGKRLSFPLFGRAALAAVVWITVFLGWGPREESQSWLARTTGWVPVATQVEGHYWWGRISAAKEEFRSLLAQTQTRLRTGEISPPEAYRTLLAIERVRDLYEKFPKLIPFMGEALFGAANAVNLMNQFYMSSREPLLELARRAGPQAPLAETVQEQYREALQLLPEAERLYREASETYRHHNVFRGWGQTQLDLASRSTRDARERSQLVATGREALTVARRIFFQPEDLFVEVDVALRVRDKEGARQRLEILLARDPGFLAAEVLPRIAKERTSRDSVTGKKTLDPVSAEMLRILLPLLDERHEDIYRNVLLLLNGNQEEELIEEYTLAGQDLFPYQTRKFMRYRILRDREELADLSGLIEVYRTDPQAKSAMSPEIRFFHLSDLLRFSPASRDWTSWEKEIEDLWEVPDLDLLRVGGHSALAQRNLIEEDPLSAWRERVRALAEMQPSNFQFTNDRRAAAIDSSFYGTGWPVLAQ